MAEVDITMLSGQHSDIRREAAEHFAASQLESMKGFDRVNADVLLSASQQRAESGAHTGEIIKEGLKGDFASVGAIKDSRFETVSRVEAAADRVHGAISDTNFNLSSRVENANDRITKDVSDMRSNLADRFFTVGRDLAEVKQGQATLSKDVELNALKGVIEGQKNTTYLSDKISFEGDKTRALLNDLKYHDLNRGLIERNAEIVEERHHARAWRDRADQSQFAALQTQLQAFGSQLQETRQGMVNFGTMAGVGQTSSSNNV